MKFLLKNKSMFSDNSGIALPLVLMVMLILILFGTAAYTASQSSLKQSVRLDPTLQCKYLARSAVDATKEAWKAQWLNESTTVSTDATFYTKYNETNNEFESVDESSDDYVIKTIQKYDSATGVCTITSSVKIGDHSATVKARSEKLTDTVVTGDAAADEWYENKVYTLTYWLFGEQVRTWSHWTILPGPKKETVVDKNSKTYSATYHTTEGKVIIDTDTDSDGNKRTLYANGDFWEKADISNPYDFAAEIFNLASDLLLTSPTQLLQDENLMSHYSITGLQAKQIIFECPVNLYKNTSLTSRDDSAAGIRNPHSLILSAETIEFKETLTIGDSAYGNLTLRLPPGAGIPGNVVYKRVAEANTNQERTSDIDLDIIDFDARYGLVKFSSVVVEASTDTSKNNPALISGKAFFFRIMDEKALNIGTEPNTFSILAGWFGFTNEENDCRFQTLLDKGYLIEATNDDLDEFSDILFIYE